MSAIRLRPATRADDPFFRKIELRTTWASLCPDDRDRLREHHVRDALEVTHAVLLERPGNQVWIAEDESGERVGLLWFGINRNLITGEDEAWVYNVSVVDGHEAQGIGARLMAHAEHLAADQGFHTIGLMVASHNQRAQALYSRLDYQPTNVLMRKRLAPRKPV